jgi:hypothetical protein
MCARFDLAKGSQSFFAGYIVPVGGLSDIWKVQSMDCSMLASFDNAWQLKSAPCSSRNFLLFGSVDV